MFSEVSIARVQDIPQALRHGLDLIGGLERLVKPGQSVVIKPNLTAGKPASSGGTTDVKVVEALIGELRRHTPSRIVVAEGAGNEMDTTYAFEITGYREMADRLGIELYDCDKGGFVEVDVRNPLAIPKVRLPRIIMESDVYISVPVIKTHVHCGISVSLKNAFGLIPDVDKMSVHREGILEQTIVDINSARSPDLVVVSGLLGAEGIAGGIDFNHPVKCDLIICGRDPVAVDAVCVRLMGQNPRVRHICWADEAGIGCSRMEFIRIKGLPLDEVSFQFMSPREQLMQQIENLNLIDADSCSGCRSLVEGGLNRFAAKALLRPLAIGYGPGLAESELHGDTSVCILSTGGGRELILVGDCAEGCKANAARIAGCPPSPQDFRGVLDKSGIICRRCEEKAIQAVDGARNLEFIQRLRILASGREVFRGKLNEGRLDDLLVLVGDCERRYNEYHGNRVRKLKGIQPRSYMRYVGGCPPSREEILAALKSFEGYSAVL